MRSKFAHCLSSITRFARFFNTPLGRSPDLPEWLIPYGVGQSFAILVLKNLRGYRALRAANVDLFFASIVDFAKKIKNYKYSQILIEAKNKAGSRILQTFVFCSLINKS